MNLNYYKSDIPWGTKEKIISSYREEKNAFNSTMIWYEVREYWLNGELRGTRMFNREGKLMIETPIKNNKRHGNAYRWYENGETLEFVQPFQEGLYHGITMQWSPEGKLLGTSLFKNGTGYDIWWNIDDKNSKKYIAELRYYLEGEPHGVEWWFLDEQSVFMEQYYWKGELHGIERHWRRDDQLEVGYPKFYLLGKQVDQETYIKATQTDNRLPKFRLEDQLSKRAFHDVLPAHSKKSKV